jgi:hypothetical protein
LEIRGLVGQSGSSLLPYTREGGSARSCDMPRSADVR